MGEVKAFDVAVVGGGISGMATAARLQAAGLRTVVLEAHGLPGGCAGYFRRSGFSFDVGATTLVDFGPGGIGTQLLEALGTGPLAGEQLPGYVAWLPDRTAVLHRDAAVWSEERLRVFGDSPAHRALWRLFDHLAEVFWRASRRGVKLPIRSLGDWLRAVRSVGLRHLPLARYLGWTVQDALCAHGLQGDRALRGLLAMLLEDTVHATVERAPLLNAVLGTTIRAAGLTRARGGMFGFWRTVTQRYRELGGLLRVGTAVHAIRPHPLGYALCTRRGVVHARVVVSSLTAAATSLIGPPEVAEALSPFLERDASAQGGAMAVFLGVPEDEVADQPFTHHQLLQSYDAPLGDGNNMFISVSAQGTWTARRPATGR
jgi:phytoene dehydrogenase-like protein